MGVRVEKFPGKMEMRKVDKPFVTKTGKAACQKVRAWVLSEEQKEWLKTWFPMAENAVIMKASGMSHSTLHRFARQLGLVKSEKGLKGIMKRQARKAKRVCEANGWYDSIRGKAPSAATMEGTARMWAEIRDGKRLHPMKIIKQKNPRRYKKIIKQKSEARKEMIRKERLRMKYGLERKTKLRMVKLDKYTQSQLGHRHHAYKRGYLLGDCSENSGERYMIFWDEDTERGEIFERNLRRDGFEVRRI